MVLSWLRWWWLPRWRCPFSHFHHGSNIGWVKPSWMQWLSLAGLWGLLVWGLRKTWRAKLRQKRCWRQLGEEDNLDPSGPWKSGSEGTILVDRATALDCQREKHLLQGSAEHGETRVILSSPTTAQCLGFAPACPSRAQSLQLHHSLQNQKNIRELTRCYEYLPSKNTKEKQVFEDNISNHFTAFQCSLMIAMLWLKVEVWQSGFTWVDSNGWESSPLAISLWGGCWGSMVVMGDLVNSLWNSECNLIDWM